MLGRCLAWILIRIFNGVFFDANIKEEDDRNEWKNNLVDEQCTSRGKRVNRDKVRDNEYGKVNVEKNQAPKAMTIEINLWHGFFRIKNVRIRPSFLLLRLLSFLPCDDDDDTTNQQKQKKRQRAPKPKISVGCCTAGIIELRLPSLSLLGWGWIVRFLSFLFSYPMDLLLSPPTKRLNPSTDDTSFSALATKFGFFVDDVHILIISNSEYGPDNNKEDWGDEESDCGDGIEASVGDKRDINNNCNRGYPSSPSTPTQPHKISWLQLIQRRLRNRLIDYILSHFVLELQNAHLRYEEHGRGHHRRRGEGSSLLYAFGMTIDGFEIFGAEEPPLLIGTDREEGTGAMMMLEETVKEMDELSLFDDGGGYFRNDGNHGNDNSNGNNENLKNKGIVSQERRKDVDEDGNSPTPEKKTRMIRSILLSTINLSAYHEQPPQQIGGLQKPLAYLRNVVLCPTSPSILITTFAAPIVRIALPTTRVAVNLPSIRVDLNPNVLRDVALTMGPWQQKQKQKQKRHCAGVDGDDDNSGHKDEISYEEQSKERIERLIILPDMRVTCPHITMTATPEGCGGSHTTTENGSHCHPFDLRYAISFSCRSLPQYGTKAATATSIGTQNISGGDGVSSTERRRLMKLVMVLEVASLEVTDPFVAPTWKYEESCWAHRRVSASIVPCLRVVTTRTEEPAPTTEETIADQTEIVKIGGMYLPLSFDMRFVRDYNCHSDGSSDNSSIYGPTKSSHQHLQSSSATLHIRIMPLEVQWRGMIVGVGTKEEERMNSVLERFLSEVGITGLVTDGDINDGIGEGPMLRLEVKKPNFVLLLRNLPDVSNRNSDCAILLSAEDLTLGQVGKDRWLAKVNKVSVRYRVSYYPLPPVLRILKPTPVDQFLIRPVSFEVVSSLFSSPSPSPPPPSPSLSPSPSPSPPSPFLLSSRRWMDVTLSCPLVIQIDPDIVDLMSLVRELLNTTPPSPETTVRKNSSWMSEGKTTITVPDMKVTVLGFDNIHHDDERNLRPLWDFELGEVRCSFDNPIHYSVSGDIIGEITMEIKIGSIVGTDRRSTRFPSLVFIDRKEDNLGPAIIVINKKDALRDGAATMKKPFSHLSVTFNGRPVVEWNPETIALVQVVLRTRIGKIGKTELKSSIGKSEIIFDGGDANVTFFDSLEKEDGEKKHELDNGTRIDKTGECEIDNDEFFYSAVSWDDINASPGSNIPQSAANTQHTSPLNMLINFPSGLQCRFNKDSLCLHKVRRCRRLFDVDLGSNTVASIVGTLEGGRKLNFYSDGLSVSDPAKADGGTLHGNVIGSNDGGHLSSLCFTFETYPRLSPINTNKMRDYAVDLVGGRRRGPLELDARGGKVHGCDYAIDLNLGHGGRIVYIQQFFLELVDYFFEGVLG